MHGESGKSWSGVLRLDTDWQFLCPLQGCEGEGISISANRRWKFPFACYDQRVLTLFEPFKWKENELKISESLNKHAIQVLRWKHATRIFLISRVFCCISTSNYTKDIYCYIFNWTLTTVFGTGLSVKSLGLRENQSVLSSAMLDMFQLFYFLRSGCKVAINRGLNYGHAHIWSLYAHWLSDSLS